MCYMWKMYFQTLSLFFSLSTYIYTPRTPPATCIPLYIVGVIIYYHQIQIHIIYKIILEQNTNINKNNTFIDLKNNHRLVTNNLYTFKKISPLVLLAYYNIFTNVLKVQPCLTFIYSHSVPISLRVVENIGVVDNSLLLKYITILCATLQH